MKNKRTVPVISGFFYTREMGALLVNYTVEEWKVIVARVLKEGGRRRIETGDTFLHDSKGALVYEAWANIAAPAAKVAA